MSHDQEKEQEKERVRKIIERQIANRNPGDSRIRGYNWDKHNEKNQRNAARKKKESERFLLFTLWDTLPQDLKWGGYGFFIGTLVGLPMLLLPPEWRLLMAIPPLIGAILGMLLDKLLS